MNSKQKFKINANVELANKFKFLSEMIANLGKPISTDCSVNLEMIDAWHEQVESYKKQFDNLTTQTLDYIKMEAEHAKLRRNKDEKPNIVTETNEPPSLEP